MKIGIDIGGMSVKYGLVDEDNKIVAKHTIPTNIEISANEFIECIGDGIFELLEMTSNTMEDIKGIGVGCPGIINSRDGIVIYSNNINWRDVPLVSQLKSRFSVPIGIANDADTAGLGEVYAGSAKGLSNAVLITLGTGVGSGVIIDKKIFEGALVGGCELGHMIIESEGVPCTCGGSGCLEAYASASAVMKMGRDIMQQVPDCKLNKECNGDLSKLTAKMIFEIAEQGDEHSQAIVDKYIKYLSIGISSIINIFRPEVIILGGGIANQKEKLTSKLQPIVNNLVFGKEDSQIPKIITSQLGNDAGIIGAVNLV